MKLKKNLVMLSLSIISIATFLLLVDADNKGVKITQITTELCETEFTETTKEIAETETITEVTTEVTTEETTVEETEEERLGNRWGIELTDEEITMLEQITMLEAGCESNKGQQAVVEVILNRIYCDVYPNDMYSVLSQNGQFTTWSYRQSANVTKRVKRNVQRVLAGGTDILPYETLYFSQGPLNSRIQCQIGGHYFCNQ